MLAGHIHCLLVAVDLSMQIEASIDLTISQSDRWRILLNVNVAIACPAGDADLLKAVSGTHLLPVQVQFRETAPLNLSLLKQRVTPTDRELALSLARQRLQVSHVVTVVRLVAHALVAGQRILVYD